MANTRPGLAVERHSRRFRNAPYSSNRPLKLALWLVWLPIIVVLWLMLLDTSYDWISSPSDFKVVSGVLILILMGCVIIAVVLKGAKKLWTR
jgi:hypothetical protein